MSEITIPGAVTTNWPPLHNALHQSIQSDDFASVKSMLDDGADITVTADTHVSTNTTILHAVADSDLLDALNILFDHGATCLLEMKCGPGEEGRRCGYTALNIAAKLGRHQLARNLIASGALYDAFSMASMGNLELLTETLYYNKELLQTRDSYGATLLHWAAAQDQHSVANMLIQEGADVNAEDDFGETPLLIASVRRASQNAVLGMTRRLGLAVRFRSIVDLLIQGGAIVDVSTAAALAQNTMLDCFLNDDPGLVSTRNRHGTTPLHWAARNGHLDTVRILLDSGADINAKDRIGCPPLWYAAYWSCHPVMSCYLCEYGADVEFRNIWGKGLEDYDCGNCGVNFDRYR